MNRDHARTVLRPRLLLEHTDAVIGAVQRYHSALAHMMAAEHTIREVVDNALVAGVSPGAVRGIINSFANAADAPILSAADVDHRLDDVADGEDREEHDDYESGLGSPEFFRDPLIERISDGQPDPGARA